MINTTGKTHRKYGPILLGQIMLLSPFTSSSGFSDNTQHSQEAVQSHHSQHLEQVYVTGGEEALPTIAGSAHIVDEATLEKFDYIDIHQIVSTIPGVYVRSEDGYGLRPNIGMRGATAERSQKITLMEDGVLIGPAPYSAPAAYYFPNVARMSAVEVFKGPVAIQ